MYAPHRFWNRAVLGVALPLVWIVASGCGSGAPVAGLGESEIEAVLQQIDAAVEDHDVDGIMAHIAEDAELAVTTRMGGRSQTQQLSASQYRRALKEAFEQSQDYEYERIEAKIDVALDGASATVDSRIEESMRIRGRNFRSDTDENAVFEHRDGRFMLTSVQAEIQVR